MEKNVISVSASAKAKLPPDTVEIRLTAKGEAKKYAEAVECADAVADVAVATFKKAGFDNVRSDTPSGTTKRLSATERRASSSSSSLLKRSA